MVFDTFTGYTATGTPRVNLTVERGSATIRHNAAHVYTTTDGVLLNNYTFTGSTNADIDDVLAGTTFANGDYATLALWQAAVLPRSGAALDTASPKQGAGSYYTFDNTPAPAGSRSGLGTGLDFAPNLPEAFVDAEWVPDTGSTEKELDIDLASLPDSDNTITDVEYDTDADDNWISLGAATGVVTITMAAANTSYDIRLRAVSNVGNGLPGNTETATSGAVAASDPVVTYIASTILADAATITWTAADIGTPDANRRVIVTVTSRGLTKTINGVTLGGNAMTALVERNATGTRWTAGIYFIDVAAGTTADIVVNYAGAPFVDTLLATYVIDKTSIGSTGTVGAEAASANSVMDAFNATANSAAIAIGGVNGSPATFAQSHEDAAWADDVDTIASGEKLIVSSANAMAVDAASDVTWTRSAGTSEMGYIGVVFKP